MSIVVPVYNAEKYLRVCLDSIVNQTYQNLDIVLVDDGSTDDSGAICDDFAETDKRVCVIHKSRGGQSDARNVGISHAKGEWLVLVDSDDKIHNRQIEALLKTAQHYQADIAVGGYLAVYDDEMPIDEKVEDNFLQHAQIITEKHLYDDTFIHEVNSMFTNAFNIYRLYFISRISMQTWLFSSLPAGMKLLLKSRNCFDDEKENQL